MSEAERSTTAPERRAPRWMWVVLVVSLGLNLLVAGVVASAAWHFHARGGFGFQGRLAAYLSTLPPQRSEALQGIVSRAQPTLQPLRQEIRQTRREAAQIFAADPLDKEALAATHARLLDAEVRIRQAYAQLMTELAESMTVEERRAFIAWRERHRRGPHRSVSAESSE